MSVENSVLGHNPRKERKEKQFNAVKRLISEDIPVEINKKVNRCEDGRIIVLGRGSDRRLPFFISNYKREDTSYRLMRVRENDLRMYTNAYIMDLNKYFPEELLIVDITNEDLTEEEIFNTLDLEGREDGRILMVRDTQVELEEEMYDECYYFLVTI